MNSVKEAYDKAYDIPVLTRVRIIKREDWRYSEATGITVGLFDGTCIDVCFDDVDDEGEDLNDRTNDDGWRCARVHWSYLLVDDEYIINEMELS